MRIVADFIDEVVCSIGKPEVYEDMKKKVANLCGGFPLYKEMA
jgi:glycine/serine hydroxymethyltransferase